MSEITKEDIIAYTEVQSKTAVALEKIVERLGDITQRQGDIMGKLSNGMSSDIKDIKGICNPCSQVVAALKPEIKEIKDMATENKAVASGLKNDMLWMKIIWGGLTAVIAIGLIVVEIVHKIASVKGG